MDEGKLSEKNVLRINMSFGGSIFLIRNASSQAKIKAVLKIKNKYLFKLIFLRTACG